jgi:histidyl-tRNA synthetase
MKDLLDEDSLKYKYFIENCEKIAKNYGYSYIETPSLEETALFKRSVGESSDIVNKEMYQFLDKGGNDVCLRPEGTAGIVRAFVQNKFDKAGVAKRYFYHGPMFRYERPQKGRLRCFHQFGVESFGQKNVTEDATVIAMLAQIFAYFGIDTTLKLNSLGCSECMPKYKEGLLEYLQELSHALCEDCNNRIATNPIRVLDCKNQSCQNLLKDAPKITQNLCAECDEDFKRLQKLLDVANISYEIDTNLVRGLDYYNKSAFEFVSDKIGAQSSIAGGGRYDKLVEYLDGKATYGVGFAIGVERLLDLIETPKSTREGYMLVSSSKEGIQKLFVKAQALRLESQAILEYSPKNLKNALKLADKNSALYLLYIGDDELAQDKIWMKNLSTKDESLIDF